MINKLSTFLLLLVLLPSMVSAQIDLKNAVLSGSFETNNQIYADDDVTGALAPSDKYGSNSYFNLKYKLKNLSIGIQYESYLPSLQGFATSNNGTHLVFRYATYQTKMLAITVGNYYEQFGSGLILRSYEDRQLGINTAMDGARLVLKPAKGIVLKAVYGKQRRFVENGDGYLRGLDGELDFASLMDWQKLNLSVGASYVNKFEDYTGIKENLPESVDAHSFRFKLHTGGFSLSSEYVNKSSDPSDANVYVYKTGSALLVETGLNLGSLGANLSFRRIENMDFRSQRMETGTVSTINYLPALTKLHRYSLANIYPYATQATGEIGGQAQLNYHFGRNSTIGGKYGMSLSINASMYYDLKVTSFDTREGFTADFLALGNNLLYSDINIELGRKWSRKFKTEFAYINLQYDKGQIEGGDYPLVKSHIFVADMLYKFTPAKSLRMELQHLSTKQDHKNWAAALAEIGFAPSWTVFASDMYNYGDDDKKHFYTIGGSYTKTSTRFAFSYGRQREGLLCVGGVCRKVPAYTGMSVSITSNF